MAALNTSRGWYYPSDLATTDCERLGIPFTISAANSNNSSITSWTTQRSIYESDLASDKNRAIGKQDE